MMASGLRRDPTDAPALGNFGMLQLARGNLADAEALMLRSYRLGFAPVGPTLAKVRHMLGDMEGSWEIWRDSRTRLAGRYLPEFETPAGWDRLGQMYLQEEVDARSWAAEILRQYFAGDDAVANTYRLSLLMQVGAIADAFRILLEQPFPISAGLVNGVWVSLGGMMAPSTDPAFPSFAEQIGLVEIWDDYGWPEQCSRLARQDGVGASFRCH